MILTFHFELVPVPGTKHGPDGLSRRVLQPGNAPDPPNNVDDWINDLYGLMHMINPVPSHRPQQSHIALFVSEVADITLPADEGASILYADVPWTAKAQLANAQ